MIARKQKQVMVWLMIDFSKIFNEKEVLNPTLKYRHESSDITDLVKQMNNDGLRVTNINITPKNILKI